MKEKQSIILFTLSESNPASEFAYYLSKRFERKLIVLGTGDTEDDRLSVKPDVDFTEQIVREFDPVMIVFSYSTANAVQRKHVRKILLAFRELRIPYTGVSENCNLPESIKRVTVPVGFLPEEKEKAPWSNSFIKYCGAEITLLRPKDRGTRAAKNVLFIEKFLKNQKNSCTIADGEKSSFKIEFEALKKFTADTDMFIISASRAYGLDDNFFGPKEYHVLKKSEKPVMIINPRNDIYVLCGD
ncbi:hypothetical protein ACE1ET_12570 [Saccharicrinis sp. FJH62]|uniref:hypothetical protein n=1 Tax=Saccharicrinis sp. FJH62 TaxID=3344657 RepID=UPI0035D45043